ncbi:DinB family protein [Paenibacillus sp. EC2-1]|uniref:DinB family protein n=1 Tax=Paenibacillus sp. EC2-1 TaxID=3388665 RepID=UPI003BEF4691
MMKRPSQTDYPAYYQTYVGLVPDGNLHEILLEQQQFTNNLISSLTDTQVDYRYAPGKWSIKEVLGHMIDTERIMSYRLLRIARGDQTPLAGFEENFYVDHAYYEKRSMDSLLVEYRTVRSSTLSLVRGLAEEAWERTGIANDNKISASAVAYIIAGHELHHLNVLKERYLS